MHSPQELKKEIKKMKKYYKEKTFGKNQFLTTELFFEIVDEIFDDVLNLLESK